LHEPGSAAPADRVPQCPQKGRPGVTGLPQRMQLAGEPDTRVAGTPALNAGAARAVATGELTGCGCPPGAGGTYAGPTRAADGFIGLPQSMQKRESVSFSRPQKAQDVTRGPPAGKHPWGANIGRGGGGGQ
jgi:hypothetical protein